MARDSINNSIDNFKKTYNNNSSDELTLEQAREQLRNENARKANERAKKYIQEQVALEDELKKRGVQKSSAEWLKAMRYNNRGKEDIKNEKTFIVTFSFTSISTYIMR